MDERSTPFAAAMAAAERSRAAPGEALIIAAGNGAGGHMVYSAGPGPALRDLARAVLRHAGAEDRATPPPPGARWVWCDLDGRGPSWRLALRDGPDGLHFPEDDFADDADNYADCPQIALTPPAPPAEAGR